MRIGLLGFGTVGQGVYNLTKPREDMEVAWVLCRRELALPDARVTHDFLDILGDASVDTVVEAIGGLYPAREYVMAAMQAGKNVVTANKAMMAEFYDELLPLAQEKGVLLRCTASVGGGIGWLSELERVRRIETVRHVGGIMNGTCNYILDSMTRLGLGYQEALGQRPGPGLCGGGPLHRCGRLRHPAQAGGQRKYRLRREPGFFRRACGGYPLYFRYGRSGIQKTRPGVQAGFLRQRLRGRVRSLCGADPVPHYGSGSRRAHQL